MADDHSSRYDAEPVLDVMKTFFQVLPEVFTLDEFFRKYRRLSLIDQERRTGGGEAGDKKPSGGEELCQFRPVGDLAGSDGDAVPDQSAPAVVAHGQDRQYRVSGGKEAKGVIQAAAPEAFLLLDDLLASDLQGGVTADNTLDGSAADGDYRRRRFRSRRH